VNLEALDSAIDGVCQELATKRVECSGWPKLTEHAIFREVAASILGSRVSFEMASAATQRLADEGLLTFRGDDRSYFLRVKETLGQPLSHPRWSRPRRYRFPSVRSKALTSTAVAFYAGGGTIKGWLNGFPDGQSARRAMVARAAGVGPKQASMILRNIGFCDDLAVLDSHLMRFMRLRGLVNGQAVRVSTLNGYERVESRFLDCARKAGWPAAVFDIAVWIVMRVSRKPA